MAVDLNSLPPDIKAYIDAEIAKAKAANEPPAPRVVSPAERVENAVAQATALLAGDRPISAGSRAIHSLVLAALEDMRKAVYPEQSNAAQAASSDTAEA